MAYDDDQLNLNDEEETDDEEVAGLVDEDGDPIDDKDEEDLGTHGFHDTEEEEES